jgi:hypothetical protein
VRFVSYSTSWTSQPRIAGCRCIHSARARRIESAGQARPATTGAAAPSPRSGVVPVARSPRCGRPCLDLHAPPLRAALHSNVTPRVSPRPRTRSGARLRRRRTLPREPLGARSPDRLQRPGARRRRRRTGSVLDGVLPERRPDERQQRGHEVAVQVAPGSARPRRGDAVDTAGRKRGLGVIPRGGARRRATSSSSRVRHAVAPPTGLPRFHRAPRPSCATSRTSARDTHSLLEGRELGVCARPPTRAACGTRSAITTRRARRGM